MINTAFKDTAFWCGKLMPTQITLTWGKLGSHSESIIASLVMTFLIELTQIESTRTRNGGGGVGDSRGKDIIRECCEYCITSLSVQSWQHRDRRKPESGTMPYSYFALLFLFWNSNSSWAWCCFNSTAVCHRDCMAWHLFRHSQKTQNICVTFAPRRPDVFDAGPTLYKCYTNVLCLLGWIWLANRDPVPWSRHGNLVEYPMTVSSWQMAEFDQNYPDGRTALMSSLLQTELVIRPRSPMSMMITIPRRDDIDIDTVEEYQENDSSPWIWKGVSATLQSGRYTLSYPRGRISGLPRVLSQ